MKLSNNSDWADLFTAGLLIVRTIWTFLTLIFGSNLHFCLEKTNILADQNMIKKCCWKKLINLHTVIQKPRGGWNSYVNFTIQDLPYCAGCSMFNALSAYLKKAANGLQRKSEKRSYSFTPSFNKKLTKYFF